MGSDQFLNLERLTIRKGNQVVQPEEGIVYVLRIYFLSVLIVDPLRINS